MILLRPMMSPRRQLQIGGVLRRSIIAGLTNSEKTVCPNGHNYDRFSKRFDMNGNRLPDGRRCSVCTSERQRKRYSEDLEFRQKNLNYSIHYGKIEVNIQKRNTRNRNRYRTDTEYRQKILDANKEYRSKKRGMVDV